MKLAEALLLRADRNRTYEQLRGRIRANARYQEGEAPSESSPALVQVTVSILDDLERLIRQINRTNSATVLADGRTLTDALAERDVLRLRYTLYTGAAEAGSAQSANQRATRSELKVVSDLDVPLLRRQASDVARRTRELDAAIQQANWTTDLLED